MLIGEISSVVIGWNENPHALGPPWHMIGQRWSSANSAEGLGGSGVLCSTRLSLCPHREGGGAHDPWEEEPGTAAHGCGEGHKNPHTENPAAGRRPREAEGIS